ncbi:FimV/HubP family polar landmark protein [Pseudomonas sp. ATCC 13867]|uniref:FimV/HubP family polar landmark protein n=1 Tax=Pseudomonas sp. ATCC 13867 TaxID=1294143 RepID=UPI00059EF4A9|nr:FimV/HubP family polar landmark protein [Pseudomonas sp. ATCC 13867]
MIRLRKLVQAIAAASALTTGMAHALGLGDIHLRSALNQPLDAEIDLVEVRDLSSSEVIPKLASPEDFNKAGVDRQYFLTGLKFTPIVKPNGKSVIRVTSDRPVQEPYLNFLVEVLWPNGRLLREYTVLLDPPLYSPQTAAAAAPRAPSAAPAPIARQPVASRPAAVSAPRPAAAEAPAPRRLEGNEYRTGRNDTLWEIAARARPNNSVSVQQTMLAIQDLNPDAFLGGNINRLKSGQVLRLPDAEQIKSRSQPEAVVEVNQQHTAWREGRSLPVGGARQLDATPRANAGAAPSQAESKDSLRLVSGEDGKAKGGDKGDKDGKAIADKLAVTQESLDSTRRENDELQSRMSDLQSQMDKLQKLIELKDAQLAKLQGELGKAPQDAGQAPAADAPAAAPQPATPDQAAAPVQSAEPAPPAEPAEPAEPVAPAAPVAPEASAPVAPAAQPAPAPEAPKPAEAQKAPTPAPVEQPAPSFIDELLANPVWLGAIAGSALLALLVLLMVISRRRAAQEREQLDAESEADEQGLGGDLALGDSDLDSLDIQSATEVAAPVASTPEQVAAQTSDALGEADIYIAYGRFNQAAELLQGAIYDEPQRTDLRLKLMEVYAEIGDREGFARQENELREMGGADSQVEQLKSRYPGMVALAAVGAAGAAAVAAADEFDSFSLDDLTLDSPAQPEPVAEPASLPGDLDDAFDLALDDLELEDGKPVAPAEDKSDELSLSGFDLDDDLAFDAPVAEPAKSDDDFAFDLDLGEEPAAKPADVSLSDDLADFALDLDKDAPASAEENFLLGLEDDAASLSSVGAEAFSFDKDAGVTQSLADLPDDFDLSLPGDEPEPVRDGDSFSAQLDEVSAELDRLAGDVDESKVSSPALESEPDASFATSELEIPAEGADEEDEFDFLSGADEAATKLDLARAYIDMGDTEGARDILDEVLAEGNDNQQQEARELLGRIA